MTVQPLFIDAGWPDTLRGAATPRCSRGGGLARRRANQTDAVVGAAAETAVRVLGPHAGEVEALFTGGDRGLVDDVLADPRLRALAALRRGPALEVGEPTKAVLLETPSQFRAVDVHIVEPGER